MTALTATGFTPTNLTFDTMREMERESAAPFDADVKANVIDPVFRAAWDAWYTRAWRPFFERYAGDSAPLLTRLGALLESDDVARRAERFRTELADFVATYAAQGLPPTRAAFPVFAIAEVAPSAGRVPPWLWLAGGIAGGLLGASALARLFRRRPHKSGPVRRIAR